MYNVIIVDDEPSASRHISMILEKYGKGFQIVAIAENGKEAIELIKSKPCDLVITDVRMPVMNGIELIEWIAKEEGKLKIIVTSGYQEFDYVQKAINLGANSYLLKPVMPNKLAAMLKKIKEKLDEDYLLDYKKLFNAFYFNEPVDMVLLKKVFPKDRYYLGVKRVNGLPTRYNKRNAMEIFAEQNKSTIIYGRDLYEELFFVPMSVLSGLNLVDYINSVSNLQQGLGYETIIYYSAPLKVEEFYTKVRELYRGLDSAIVIGENQSLTLKEVNDRKTSQPSNLENDDLEMIYFYIKDKNEVALQKEQSSLFDKWKKEKRSQIYIESQAKQILYKVRCCYGDKISLLESEYLVEEIFTYSVNMDELKANYWEIMLKYIQGCRLVDKIDTPQFLNKITKYLDEHIDQQFSLRDVCNKFGVSQPYLSKMFRKYINESYNGYVTRIRIKKAKELMKKNPDMRVKDVAAMVGYEDQFYFSRIFRSIIDATPTEYMNGLKEDL